MNTRFFHVYFVLAKLTSMSLLLEHGRTPQCTWLSCTPLKYEPVSASVKSLKPYSVMIISKWLN